MPNIQPIFSRVSDIQSVTLLTAAADYVGQNVFNAVCFKADPVSGGYIQRLRFKALGTNVTTVARIYISNPNGINAPACNVPQSLTGTPSGTGGSLLTQNAVAKVYALDPYGVPTSNSTESANVAVVSATGVGSIVWNWNASGNANSYILTVGKTPGSEERYFLVTGANTYTQTTIPANNISEIGSANNNQIFNNYFFGEISLPATTASATGATQDIDYPMNLALPPGYKVVVGLGTTVAAGWSVTGIGGKY